MPCLSRGVSEGSLGVGAFAVADEDDLFAGLGVDVLVGGEVGAGVVLLGEACDLCRAGQVRAPGVDLRRGDLRATGEPLPLQSVPADSDQDRPPPLQSRGERSTPTQTSLWTAPCRLLSAEPEAHSLPEHCLQALPPTQYTGPDEDEGREPGGIAGVRLLGIDPAGLHLGLAGTDARVTIAGPDPRQWRTIVTQHRASCPDRDLLSLWEAPAVSPFESAYLAADPPLVAGASRPRVGRQRPAAPQTVHSRSADRWTKRLGYSGDPPFWRRPRGRGRY